MYGLLADHNCEGQLQVLLQVCRNERWRDIWLSLQVQIHTFKTLGLEIDAPDSTVWTVCQKKLLFLVTANRNDDGPNSLQATIARSGTIESLPVLTLGDGDAILDNREYAERAALRLMEILIAPDDAMGTGRLYLPSNAKV